VSVDVTALSAVELSEAIHRGDVSCREAMTAFLDRIAERNPAVNAIVSLRDHDQLLAEAAVCDEETANGTSRGWMHGMPHAVKDLAETAGLRTTMGSPINADFVPDYDCLMVARMKAAGCIVIGKTNVPEFGLGSHTFNDVFGVTRNPYDLSLTAGGSSGGAAVALATRMVPVADGSDFMGSLRNPAGWNNVFGFRPSQGRVPAWPETDSYVAQLGTEGPMGRTVLDVAMLLGTQAGYDPRMPLSLDGTLTELATIHDARRTLQTDPVGVRIGWLGDLDGYLAMESGVLDACADGLRRLQALGCSVEPTELGMAPAHVWDAWLVWRRVLVSAGLGPLAADPARRAVMKAEALWEVDEAASVTGADMTRASTARTTFYTSMLALFDHFDVLAIPTAQVWPFEATERWPHRIGDRQMDTYHRWMEVTTYATFAGLPAISVPVGFDPRGLPMGMQLIGRPRGDIEVLRLAHAYESTITDLAVGAA
jgi:amidase